MVIRGMLLCGTVFLRAALDKYPLSCVRSGDTIIVTIELGAAAENAKITYAPDSTLMVRTRDGKDDVTLSVEQCVAWLTITRKESERERKEGDIVVSYYSGSSTTTYPYILPFCVRQSGAHYSLHNGQVQLIFLPASKPGA